MDRLLKETVPLREAGLQALLAGGDDYELCFSAPRARDADITALGRELRVALTRIGDVTATPGFAVCDGDGNPLHTLPAAFDHFAT